MANASFADSNRVSLRGIAEANDAWGVTPANGKSRELRITSSSLALNKQTVMSEELRADRMVSSIAEVGATTEGEINFEFSAGSQDDYLQAFVLGAWSRPMTFDAFRGAKVGVTANNTFTVSGGDFTGYFVVGRKIKTEDFVNPANNGYHEISAVATANGSTTVTVTGTALVVEAAADSKRSKLMDANDVIVRNAALRLGTNGLATIDSNGANLFAAAVAAGQLVTGQKIFVDGAGVQTATVTFADAPAAGATVVLSDGESVYSFTAGIEFAVGADEAEAAANLALAINKARVKGLVDLSATAAAGVVTVKNLRNADGTVAESNDSTNQITVTAFTDADEAARGFFTVVEAAADVLTVDRIPTTIADGLFTVKGSMLRNPSDIDDITPQSFTFETAFNDVKQFMIHDGCRIGTFSLEVASGSIVTGTMAVAGKSTKALAASKLGSAPYTVLQTTDTEVMNATTNVGQILKDGVNMETAIQSITFEGDATLRNQMAVSSKFPRGIGTGRFQLTGALTAYFENLELWRDFEQHETVSLSFPFSDLDNNTYYITVPAMKFASDPVSPGGIDQDVVEEIEWMAFRDSATGCMLQVDRFSSVKPV